MVDKKRDPWTDPDPQPGDFDEYVREMNPSDPDDAIIAPDCEMHFLGHNDIDRWLRELKERREAEARARVEERQRA